MSYHLNVDKNKKVEIEMPPLPEEGVNTQETQVEASSEQIEEVQAAPEPQQEQVVEQQKKDSTNDKNIRALREKAERAERLEWERDEAVKRLAQYEAQKHTPQEVEEPDYNINEDDLVEGKHLRQYNKKLKKVQEELKQQQQQNYLTTTEIRLRNEYPDFDKIVSSANIEQLRNRYPELADTLNNSNTDVYTKAKSAYKLIKDLGISPDDNYEQDRQRAITNAAKPKPLASVSPQQGDSPLSKANAFANGLTDDLAKQLRKEMYEAMKNR